MVGRNCFLRDYISRTIEIMASIAGWLGTIIYLAQKEPGRVEREKAPAAVCRKVAMTKNGDAMEVWGDGTQTRSFLYIDECVEATIRLMRSGI